MKTLDEVLGGYTGPHPLHLQGCLTCDLVALSTLLEKEVETWKIRHQMLESENVGLRKREIERDDK